MALGEKLAELRRQQKWTQKVFAEKIGVHTNHITRWESNRFKPSPAVLEKIAQAFGVPINELVDGQSFVPQSMAHDRELVRRIEELKELDAEQRSIIYSIIDTFAKQKRMERLLLGEKALSAAS